MQMRPYAVERASALLGRLVFRANRAVKQPDPEAIHDLRVAIRRFSQCLRVFRAFFPRGEVKKVRRRLRRVMDLAAEVRDRDIALQVYAEAGAPSQAALALQLGQERQQAKRELVEELGRIQKRDFSSKWRKRLQL